MTEIYESGWIAQRSTFCTLNNDDGGRTVVQNFLCCLLWKYQFTYILDLLYSSSFFLFLFFLSVLANVFCSLLLGVACFFLACQYPKYTNDIALVAELVCL